MEELEQKDSKNYYTPHISEFHVGFEFEYLIPYEHNFKKSVFGEVFTNTGDLKYFLKKKAVRVKYLNIEDIENLKFKQKNGYEDTVIFNSNMKYDRTKENIKLLYNFKSRWCCIFTGEYMKVIKSISDDKIEYHISSNLFAGFIKNKNELKVLLKQLGI